jgi:glucose-6-phosphate isomerase
MIPTTDWNRFNDNFLACVKPALWLDISRMSFDASFFGKMQPLIANAYEDMKKLEAGDIANPDEGRQVGHYWLRNADIAPAEHQSQIKRDLAEISAFAKAVHDGDVLAEGGQKFDHILLIGIGGSALGPQLVDDALAGHSAKMGITFFDNTDPDGMDRDLAALDGKLGTILAVVISKSGGTAETRNGMLEAQAAYKKAGLNFGKHAIAVTGKSSKLDNFAKENEFLGAFPMEDYVGGRTSVMSVVGLVPAALQGVDITAFLEGAKDMDILTRNEDTKQNPSMLLALMWHFAGKGKGEKDMVILPYKDRLTLFSKYLQQLVMESLGKELDLDKNKVNQGIAVYGNKGSTDQHAYVQQLRDGVNNFFATFIEVRQARASESMKVEDDFTSGDFLQGFFRGTREALAGNDRETITISIPKIDAYYLGTLIALFERTVSFYASLVNINAYHQPGVEAGKKAAGEFLTSLGTVTKFLQDNKGTDFVAEEIKIDLDPETIFHCLVHLSHNNEAVTLLSGTTPATMRFSFS